jgi:NTP pyrophosphatase (non-canonical NTP hydrolase)
MDLNEFQAKATAQISKYDHYHKITHDVEFTLIHLMEEFGELAREIYNEKSGRDKLDLKNLSGEMADILILIAQLAKNYNIQLETAATDKLKELKGRLTRIDELKRQPKP